MSLLAKKQNVINHSIFGWILAGLALSLGVSKAGVGIFSILLLLVFSGFIVKYRKEISLQSVSAISRWLILLFSGGVLFSLLSLGGVDSAKDFMNKGSVLLVVPICLYLLRDERNRALALYGLLLGAVIASLYSLFMWITLLLSGEPIDRIASFWDLGRWGEYVCYLLVFLLPTFSNRNLGKVRTAIGVSFILVLLALLVSGMRGPLLAVAISFCTYFIVLNRRYLLRFTALSIIGVIVLAIAAPELIDSVWVRFISIFDLTQNISNLARINMWIYAVDFFQYNLVNDWRSVLFGSGFEHLSPSFTAFLQQGGYLSHLAEEASLNDHHNAFLNVMNKMGLIYLCMSFFGAYLVLSALWTRYKQYRGRQCSWLHSAILVVLSYIVIGLFYSNELNYQTLMAAFMCCLAIRFYDAEIIQQEEAPHV
ncbi:hypothetical protein BCU70_19790 [Vibrio sp. 10N.286.49.C2]|nr:hypothetical protein BCU70_19790 [Vibrio sp. 10N.286.49.C2]PMH46991.1 hypothetical protein BCU66_22105 [Vibrio sp. 10N.286.49.B1]